MGDRTILHSDMNSFYASVEMLHHPEFAGMPLAVGGDPEARHGIVLTANYIAKRKGVKTGMALWQAKQICPEIIFVPPRMDLYLRFSQMAREIYSEYTDKIEPYGIDEAWLDVSDSRNLKGSGITIAREISHRIKYELGVTVSIGISWNKIYAKLGSDYKKPDAITEFNRENYKSMIWQLPASDLLYVGRQTRKKLQKLGIRTIGELAESDEAMLESHFGKMGIVLWSFANGWDDDPVCKDGYTAPVKSIGNVLRILCERLKAKGYRLSPFVCSRKRGCFLQSAVRFCLSGSSGLHGSLYFLCRSRCPRYSARAYRQNAVPGAARGKPRSACQCTAPACPPAQSAYQARNP